MAKVNQSLELAILVISCDAYSDAADVFFELIKKYWTDCKYPLFFINNSIIRNYNNTTLINAGNELEWSGRLKKSLSQINEKYVLFMLEDYYISKKVNSDDIANALKIMEQEGLKYYRITNFPKLKGTFKNYNFLSTIPDNQRYGINLQAAIWRKDFLLDILGEKDCSAWEIETDQLKYVKNQFTENIEGCVVDTRNIIDIYNGVIKGKWVPKTLNHLKKGGYIVPEGEREKMSINSRLVMSLKLIGADVLSNNMQKGLKPILSKLGFRFTSKY